MRKIKMILIAFVLALIPGIASANDSDLKIPELDPVQNNLLKWGGISVCILGLLFGWLVFRKIKKIRAHESMLDVAETIFATCKTYLKQQGVFLILLYVIIGLTMAFYFGFLQQSKVIDVLFILLWTVLGISGSYGVAYFGIRMNTLANSRMAFTALRNKPIELLKIPLEAGMSIGVVLVCVELIMMLVVLLFVPRHLAGACFIGFAIGESLGASVLRIAGGIFTKIADIGSDLMKVFFKIPEDDARNPGVIADCAGDNAGDSVGPTADGFETYGVTGVALISFIVLSVGFVPGISEADKLHYQTLLLTWIFVIRIMMVLTSILAYKANNWLTSMLYKDDKDLDFEKPLTNLIWMTSILSIIMTFIVSYWQLSSLPYGLWITFSTIISIGTLSAALIPEITKIFTSTKSAHVKEIVKSSEEGGASLNIISGIVSGNFSAFWLGFVFIAIMTLAVITSSYGLGHIMQFPVICAFGLVAFGMLGMGPVTIAVDSYGPVTDNAQSIYELSLIEGENTEIGKKKIEKDFDFIPNFDKAKYHLEANDSAGNTFKATAKPVLIGTAAVGAMTMIFSLILVIQNKLGVDPRLVLTLTNPYTTLGFMLGAGTIFWFSGATIQAVAAGAYRAVEYIKQNINIDNDASKKASTETSNEVVRICTKYAQKGMFNIFIAVFSIAMGVAFISGYRDVHSASQAESISALSLFVSYLFGLTTFGLFQAIYMANAGGAWDNAKKLVEVELKKKGTDLHDATVIGDTVGDPFKDTSSVSLNPVIKFTTLFGMLAIDIAISDGFYKIAPIVGLLFIGNALIFIYRSFYMMRIK